MGEISKINCKGIELCFGELQTGITLFPPENPVSLRIYKKFGDKVLQEYIYFSKKLSGIINLNSSDLLEESIDIEIQKLISLTLSNSDMILCGYEAQEKKYVEEQKKSGDYFINNDGKIIGINLGFDGEAMVFKIRVNNPTNLKIKFNSRNIDYHGFDGAFNLTIELYCNYWNIELTSEIKEKFNNAKIKYREEYKNL